jgi:hypothetical protein
MKNKLLYITFVSLLSLSACSGNSLQGGSEAGNPNFREVTGTVSDSTTVAQAFTLFRTAQAATNCPADTIVAIDTLSNVAKANIASDCSFSLNLAVGHSYSINFTLDNVFVATMIFQATSTSESTNFELTAGDAAVDLGTVVISGIFANPEANPFEQNDQDDDGTNDFEDTDDDDDGVDDDEDYSDCDGDGFIDEDSCEDSEEECDEDDTDCDGVKDDNDNCIDVANKDQEDEDDNDIGDVCE